MSRWRAIRDTFLPRRASTQTWMMLTFALFVGAAVVGVSLYAFLVLRGQVREAARETLHRQAERVAALLDAQPEPAALAALDAAYADVHDLDLAVADARGPVRPGRVLWSSDVAQDVPTFF